ncbi:MAG: PAS domain S-box protein, partial [Syntrophomonas sp.]|nr:PAS domain S-box protein [Syntrophomonas sp.]
MSYLEGSKPGQCQENQIGRKQKVTVPLQEQQHDNFTAFFDNINSLLFVMDLNANIKRVNRTVLERLGYSEEKLLGQNVLLLHTPEDRDSAQRIISSILTGEEKYCPLPLLSKTGEHIPVETRFFKGRWSDEEVLFGISRDISDLKISEEKFSHVFHSNVVMMTISSLKEGRYLDVNEVFCEKLEFRREDVIGRTSIELGIFENSWQRESTVKMALETEKVHNVEITVRTKSGYDLIGLYSTDIINIKNEEYLLTMITDITERRKIEEELRLKNEQLHVLNDMLEVYATTDGLTNLYNHRFIFEKLQLEIDRARRYQQPLSILMLDIDHFKKVNDSYGHQTGDQVLRTVADIIKSNLREVDLVG